MNSAWIRPVWNEMNNESGMDTVGSALAADNFQQDAWGLFFFCHPEKIGLTTTTNAGNEKTIGLSAAVVADKMLSG
jgi:hypothetical protein